MGSQRVRYNSVTNTFRSYLWHVGSSPLPRVQTWAPCIRSMES